jgi:hypothetical protein
MGNDIIVGIRRIEILNLLALNMGTTVVLSIVCGRFG